MKKLFFKKSLRSKYNGLIAIPYEIKVRDFLSRLLIVYFILRNKKFGNRKVIFGERRQLGFFCKKVQLSNYLILNLGVDRNYNYYKDLTAANGVALSLDEEGSIITPYEDKINPRQKFSKSCIQFVHKIFAWGNYEKNNYIFHNKNIEKKKIIISGNPRFDISKKKFIRSEKNYNKKKILVSFAFGLANALVDPKIESGYWKSKNPLQKKFDEFWQTVYQNQKINFNLYLKDIVKLIEEFPDEKFIIRPHPIENIKKYNRIKKFSNVTIRNSGPIQDEFNNIKLLIHPGCTTSIEAAFSRIPSIFYSPKFEKKLIPKATYLVSQVARNYNQLINILKNNYYPNRLNKIKYYISNVKYNSAEVIAEEILKIKIDKVLKFNKNLKIDYLTRFRFISHKVFNKIKLYFNKENFFSLNKKFKKRDAIKKSHISATEIKYYLKLFDKIYLQKNYKKYYTKKINQYVYEIKKK